MVPGLLRVVEIHEHHIEVTRTARFATVGDPATATQLWIACHGYRQLASRFLRPFATIAEGRFIAAPEALSRFYIDDEPGPHGPESRVGASWMTREDRDVEIRDYIAYLDRLQAHLAARISRQPITTIALGFSQGTATASRWCVLGSTRVDHLILWAGGVPPDLDLAACADRLGRLQSIVLAVGDSDPFIREDAVARQLERLQDAGLRARVERFEGGHKVVAAALERIAATL